MAETKVLGQGMVIPSPRMTATFGSVAGEKRSTVNTANIVLLDCSDSTKDPIGKSDPRLKIDGIRESMSNFVANLPVSACISIISFNTTANVLWNMAPVGQSKLEIIKKVQALEPKGTTAMLEAFLLAEEQLRNIPNGFVKRAYLLTDGLPNEDPSAIADRIKIQETQLQTIGFGAGENIDENLLKSMASLSDSGTPLYFHATEGRQLTAFLKKETQTIAE